MQTLLKNYMDILYCPLKELTLSQLYRHIKRDGYEISIDGSYNIFVQNKTSKNKILMVAHLDRILSKTPELYRYETSPGRIYGAYGWDDRAGIIAALELFKVNDIDLLFTTDEEAGCLGARDINPNKIRQYEMIFELDRHGSHDFINECSKGVLCNDEFMNDICYYIGTQGKNLKPTFGVYTDIAELRKKNDKAQMFYMSCGYYHEHTEQEYLVEKEFLSSIEIAQMIIDYANAHKIKPFVPVERPKPEAVKDNNEYYYYCPYCDDYFMEKELLYGKCPSCGRNVEIMDEEFLEPEDKYGNIQ